MEIEGMELVALGIVTTLLGLAANAFIAMLFWRLKRMDQDIELLKKELLVIRLNYLDRFDDIKDHLNKLHLETTEKISILEALLKIHLNKLK